MSLTNSPEAFHPVSSSSPGATSPAELRHMTSSGALSPASARLPTTTNKSNRHSQHLQAGRVGSKSPASIPSSPTSVHSSSSAIFERDIEPLVSPSPPLLLSPSQAASHVHHPNPHHIPRGKTTEQLEQSVPSVLDSAAAILAGMQDPEFAGEQISVEAPVVPRRDGRGSGWTSPIGSFRSRSPSPFGSKSPGRTSLLLSIPTVSSQPNQQPSTLTTSGNPTPVPAHAASPPSPRSVGSGSAGSGSPPLRPTIATTNLTGAGGSNTPPSIITPTSAYFSTTSSVSDGGEGGAGDDDEEPKTTTREKAPALPKVSTAQIPLGPSSAPASPRTPIHATSFSPSSPTSVLSHSTTHTNATATTTSTSPHATSPISPAATTSIPPSPASHNASKRLSFLSYADLLSSTPTSTLPLSSLTTAASSVEPPPHIPTVNGLVGGGGSSSPGSTSGGSLPSSFSAYLGGSGPHSTNASLRNFPLPLAPLGSSHSTSASVSGQAGAGSTGRDRDSIVFLDDLVGGEWEREGLGKGLEERLEALMPIGGKA